MSVSTATLDADAALARRIPMTRFFLCDTCKWRGECKRRSSGVTSCGKDHVINDGRFYKLDREAREECRRKNEAEIDAFFSKLRRTDRSQVRASDSGRVIYEAKPCAVRRANSRGNATEELDDGMSIARWCENCGDPFETVERSRRLCDACHDEICEYLGVSYAKIPTFSTGKTRVSQHLS